MKNFFTLTLCFLTLSITAQVDCPNPYDGNGDGNVSIGDFLEMLAVFGDTDTDSDGVWDSLDYCVDLAACNYANDPSEPCAYIDVLGVCGGGCEGDGDDDGICDSDDDCVGVYDECGVCNGPGATEVVIESITILYDSLYAEQIDEWWVFEVGADTTFTYLCPIPGCTDPTASNYDSNAIEDDGSCCYDDGVWVQIGIDIDGETADDNSGESVSISGDGTRVAIGAPYNDHGSVDNNGNGSVYTDAGHVRVYENINGTWTQLGQDIEGSNPNDYAGKSVSLSYTGNIVAIGSPENGNDFGNVQIYNYDGISWSQIGNTIYGESTDDHSSIVSLSSDGSIVAIGAKHNDGNGNSSGHVRIYNYNGSTWNQLGQDINGEVAGDQSGYSVSLSDDGNTVAIGSPHNDDNGEQSGHVRIFNFNGSSWVQIGQDIEGEASGDYNGESVSISNDGNTVAIGAIFNDGPNGDNRGHVRVFEYDGFTWTQSGQDIDGGADGDQSGYSVSLNYDGTIVAIGAPYNNDFNGEKGHVRVYQNFDSTWTKIGVIDIDGEEASDKSGWSVSISNTGNTVAIGAPFNDGNGTESGHVRVYSINTPCDPD